MATKQYEKTAIGIRLAKYRKAAGYTTTSLAEKIDDDRVTKTKLVNIELGKKADMTITELLLISRALDLSPTLLIVDESRPFAAPDAFNGINDNGISNVELAQWMARPLNTPKDRYGEIDLSALSDLALAQDFLNNARVHQLYSQRANSGMDTATGKPLTEQQRDEADMVAQTFRRNCMDDIRKLHDRGIEVPDEMISEVCDGTSLGN